MTSQLLERLKDPKTREGALDLALDALAMAADQKDADTAAYIAQQLAEALKASWMTRMHVRLRSVPHDHRNVG
jgi:DNA-binding ferritin-like protein